MIPSVPKSLLAALFLVALAGCGAPVESTDGKTAAIESPTLVTGATGAALERPAATQTDAKFSRWLVNPTGKVSGMLLDDGSIVRVHDPALDTSKLTAGDAVHVDGFAMKKDAHQIFMFASVQKGADEIVKKPEGMKLSGSKDPAAFEKKHEKGKHEKGKHEKGKAHGWKKHDGAKAEGWKKHHEEELSKLETLNVSGTVSDILPGRRGQTLVLSDGTLVYVRDDAKAVKKGDQVKVTGKGGTYPAGKALFAETIEGPTGA